MFLKFKQPTCTLEISTQVLREDSLLHSEAVTPVFTQKINNSRNGRQAPACGGVSKARMWTLGKVNHAKGSSLLALSSWNLMFR